MLATRPQGCGRSPQKELSFMFTRRLFSIAVAVTVSLVVAATARAQYKLETCINPTKTFSPKGTLRNVNAVYSFPKVPTGAGVTFIVTKNDADGEYVRD